MAKPAVTPPLSQQNCVATKLSPTTFADNAFLDALGREFQLALTSNDDGLMAIRNERLNGIRNALSEIDGLTGPRTVLMTQMVPATTR
jgi:hypothetical protein